MGGIAAAGILFLISTFALITIHPDSIQETRGQVLSIETSVSPTPTRTPKPTPTVTNTPTPTPLPTNTPTLVPPTNTPTPTLIPYTSDELERWFTT